MEEKYIVLTTLCNKESIANKIVDELLNKKLVAGVQVSKVHSKYFYNNKLEETDEYKLEFRTKESLYDEIEGIIRTLHDYEVPEISYYQITDANNEFLKWIDESTLG